jgi:hypothetical protein
LNVKTPVECICKPKRESLKSRGGRGGGRYSKYADTIDEMVSVEEAGANKVERSRNEGVYRGLVEKPLTPHTPTKTRNPIRSIHLALEFVVVREFLI